MSIISVLKVYSSLSDEQKAVLRGKKIDATHTPAEWLALLGGLAHYDRQGDALRRAAGWGIAIGLVGAFAGGIIAQSWVVALLFLLVAIAAFLLYRSLRSADLANSLREFVLPLLALMREDMDPVAPLRLRLDLGRTRAPEKKTESGPLPGPRNIVQTWYTNDWMEGSGTLADGSTLGWSIVDLVRERTITKRNPRGKTKVKTKYKVRSVIDMRIGLRRESYELGAGGRADGRVARIGVKEGEKRNVLKVRRVVLSSSPEPMLDVQDFIDPLAAAFRRATLINPEGR